MWNQSSLITVRNQLLITVCVICSSARRRLKRNSGWIVIIVIIKMIAVTIGIISVAV